MAKYKAPAGSAGINVGGQHFNVGADGCIDVPDEGNYGALLAPHGFVPVQTSAPQPSSSNEHNDQGELQ